MKTKKNDKQKPGKIASFYLKPIQQKKLSLKILVFILPILLFPVFYKLSFIPGFSDYAGVLAHDFFMGLDNFGNRQGPGVWWFHLFFFTLIFMISYCITGYLIIFRNLRNAIMRRASAIAKIIKSELELSTTSGDYDYRPLVTYKFRAMDIWCTKTYSLRNGWTEDKEGEEKVLKQYPRGKKLTVYYEENNIENNSTKKFTPGSFFIFIFKILLLSIAFNALSFLCGMLLTLFVKSFMENSPGVQFISGLLFLVIFISFFPHTVWFYECETE